MDLLVFDKLRQRAFFEKKDFNSKNKSLNKASVESESEKISL